MRWKTPVHDPARLNAMMDRKGVDLLIIRTVENSKYLSGFFHNGGNVGYRPFVVFIFRDPGKEPAMIVPAVDLHLAMERTWIRDVRAYEMSEFFTDVNTYFYADFFAAASAVLKERNVKGLRVGTEGENLTGGFRAKLDDMLASFGCTTTDVSIDIDIVRMVKTPVEIQCLKRACEITVKAHESFRAAIKPGATDNDLVRDIAVRMFKEGAHGIKTINIAAGPGTGFAAHNLFPTGYTLKYGDFARCDMGATYFGYPADFVRCWFIGETTPRHKEIWQRLNDAQIELGHWIRPGMTGGEVFDKGYALISKHLDKFPREFIGHGIGHGTHEQPRLNKVNRTVIEPNTVLCLEYSYYHEGLRHHTEDEFLIKESGVEWWAEDCPRDLVIPA